MRFSLSLPAELTSAHADSVVSCHITDISREGCKIENIPLPLGPERELTVKTVLPAQKKTVELHARVQWITQERGRACAGCFIQETVHGDKFNLLDHAYKKWRTGIPEHANGKKQQR